MPKQSRNASLAGLTEPPAQSRSRLAVYLRGDRRGRRHSPHIQITVSSTPRPIQEDGCLPAPHALFLPYPAQGHVIPFMELAHRFLDRGFAVTFINTEFNHRRVVAAAAADAPGSLAEGGGRLRLVAVADGMGEGEDHENLIMLNAAMEEAIPPQLEALLADGPGKVTCVVVDVVMSFTLDVVKRHGLPSAALWPASAAVLSVLVAADNLVRDGVIDDDGAPLNLENTSFRLAKSAPPMDATFLAWNYMAGNQEAERLVFHYLTATAKAAAAKADFLLCNTFASIEPAVFAERTDEHRTASTILPIGPLRTWQRATRHAPVGHFWLADDEACLSFLDAQPRGSVVYVAFGSIAVMTADQLQELALGLEASGRPFLWVVRPELVDKLPPGFADAITAGQGRGRVVSWAPQEQVLAHPAVGCFLTHCGWNSTLEGIRNGVPMLCWPYFTDQFTNQTYISDVWRVGLRVAPVDGGAVVTKERVVERLDELWVDEGVKERVRRLKEMAEKSMSQEGESLKNLDLLVNSMRR